MKRLMPLLFLLPLCAELQGCGGDTPTGPLLDSAAVAAPQPAGALEVKKTPTPVPTPTVPSGVAAATPTAAAPAPTPATPTPNTPVKFEILSPLPCVLQARGTGELVFTFMAGASYYSVDGAMVHYLDLQHQEVGVLGLGDFPAAPWWTVTIPWDGAAFFVELSGEVDGVAYRSETCAGVR